LYYRDDIYVHSADTPLFRQLPRRQMLLLLFWLLLLLFYLSRFYPSRHIGLFLVPP
jgi:hypothetical protein